jgi:hypothetical protein
MILLKYLSGSPEQGSEGDFMRLWDRIKYFFTRRRYKKPEATEKPEVEVKPVYAKGGDLLSIEIHGSQGFESDQYNFMLDVIKLKQFVLNSQEFRIKFLNLTCTETGGKSMREVYNHLFSGADRRNHQIDHDIDFFVELYGYKNRYSKTIGYVNNSSNKIYTSRYYLNKWMNQADGKAQAAGHWFHEYLHLMGYSHYQNKSTSMVYLGGYLVRDLAKEVLHGRKLTPVVRQV